MILLALLLMLLCGQHAQAATDLSTSPTTSIRAPNCR